MLLILLLIVLFVALFGGGYWGTRPGYAGTRYAPFSPLLLILLVLLVLWATGNLPT